VRIIVIGTGTDVGKTYVTAALARGLARHGAVLALKPIESGVEPGVDGDAGAIARAAGHVPALSPWRFRRPLSPHLVARENNVDLSALEIARWVAEQERRLPTPWSLIELAGGAFTPLGPGITNVDLATALDPALWLLVAPDALGVLHDVTATLRALPREPDAVVLSAARAADQSTGTNAAELERLGIVTVREVVAAGATAAESTVTWLLGIPPDKSS
jgi:dethiobiotin synthetase